jgi:hypothetical protein
VRKKIRQNISNKVNFGVDNFTVDHSSTGGLIIQIERVDNF